MVLAAATVGCGHDHGPGEVIQTTDVPRADPPAAGRIAGQQVRRQRAEQRERRRAARRAREERVAGATLEGLDALGARLDAEVGVSVSAPGGSAEYAGGGGLRSGSAWSTIKVPIALRLLEDVGGPAGLSESQRADIAAAITESDNAAAARLYADLSQAHGGATGAADAVGDVLARAGDSRTHVSTVGRDGFSPYGQTEWSLEAQGRFMAALVGGCIGDPASRQLLLDSMRSVSADRWGLGAIGGPALWKGGWGPGVDGRYWCARWARSRPRAGRSSSRSRRDPATAPSRARPRQRASSHGG